MDSNETFVPTNDAPAANPAADDVQKALRRLLAAYVAARMSLAQLGQNLDRAVLEQLAALKGAQEGDAATV